MAWHRIAIHWPDSLTHICERLVKCRVALNSVAHNMSNSIHYFQSDLYLQKTFFLNYENYVYYNSQCLWLWLLSLIRNGNAEIYQDISFFNTSWVITNSPGYPKPVYFLQSVILFSEQVKQVIRREKLRQANFTFVTAIYHQSLLKPTDLSAFKVYSNS